MEWGGRGRKREWEWEWERERESELWAIIYWPIKRGKQRNKELSNCASERKREILQLSRMPMWSTCHWVGLEWPKNAVLSQCNVSLVAEQNQF